MPNAYSGIESKYIFSSVTSSTKMFAIAWQVRGFQATDLSKKKKPDYSKNLYKYDNILCPKDLGHATWTFITKVYVESYPTQLHFYFN